MPSPGMTAMRCSVMWGTPVRGTRAARGGAHAVRVYSRRRVWTVRRAICAGNAAPARSVIDRPRITRTERFGVRFWPFVVSAPERNAQMPMTRASLITKEELDDFAAALRRNGWRAEDFELEEDVFDP